MLEAVESQKVVGYCQSLLEEVFCEQVIWKTVTIISIIIIIRIYSPLFHQILYLRKSKVNKLSESVRKHSLIKFCTV